MRARPAGPAESSVLRDSARSGPTREAHRRAFYRSDGLLRSGAGRGHGQGPAFSRFVTIRPIQSTRRRSGTECQQRDAKLPHRFVEVDRMVVELGSDTEQIGLPSIGPSLQEAVHPEREDLAYLFRF
jgi:hypothetical protein